MRALSLQQARRMALAAQGFGAARPGGRIDVRHVRRVLAHVGLVQIDSVNVVERAHYLPLFSRLGPYPKGLLDELTYRRRELFEYWGHEASLVPAADQPLYRQRMERFREHATKRERALVDNGFVRRVEAEIAERGPLLASELSGLGRRTGGTGVGTDADAGRGGWWDWPMGKIACEYLLSVGRLAVAGRRNFARVYDLIERVLPQSVLAAPTPAPDEARRGLLLAAARHLGVGTAADLADYHRIHVPTARRLLTDLIGDGLIEPVAVEGWSERAYRHPEARLPRRVAARALLAPFDPVVWFRPRAERLFGFRYRIEIYTPAARRVHGYYVLPFLLGDRLVARVDCKADRQAGVLRAKAAWLEEGEDAHEVAHHLAAELGTLGQWLGLGEVATDGRGDLAPALRAALR